MNDYEFELIETTTAYSVRRGMLADRLIHRFDRTLETGYQIPPISWA